MIEQPTWCTIRLEVSHNELGDADVGEIRDLPETIQNLFRELGFPAPRPIPLMPIPFQIAQKLHGLTSAGSNRARDLVDLQLLLAHESVDLSAIVAVCKRLFTYRRMQPWPSPVVKGQDWESLYVAQKGNLRVLPTVEEAIVWANDLIAQIDAAQ